MKRVKPIIAVVVVASIVLIAAFQAPITSPTPKPPFSALEARIARPRVMHARVYERLLINGKLVAVNNTPGVCLPLVLLAALGGNAEFYEAYANHTMRLIYYSGEPNGLFVLDNQGEIRKIGDPLPIYDSDTNSFAVCASGTIEAETNITYVVLVVHNVLCGAVKLNKVVGPGSTISYCVYMQLPSYFDAKVPYEVLSSFVQTGRFPKGKTYVIASYGLVNGSARTYPVLRLGTPSLKEAVSITEGAPGYDFREFILHNSYIAIPFVATGSVEIRSFYSGQPWFSFDLGYENATRAGAVIVSLGDLCWVEVIEHG